MKKVIFIILIACFTASSGYSSTFTDFFGLGKPRTNSFKKMRHTAEKQEKWAFKKVFKQELTGEEMFATMRAIMENRIYREMIKDIRFLAKFTKKHQTKKAFELILKHTKGCEKESAAYKMAFNQFLTDFVGNFDDKDNALSGRLKWGSADVGQFLTKEKMQPYIDIVMAAFEKTTIEKFKKLKPATTSK